MTKLHSVPKDNPEPPIDISALLRADIESRDWGKVMIDGDRGPKVRLPDRIRRVWR